MSDSGHEGRLQYIHRGAGELYNNYTAALREIYNKSGLPDNRQTNAAALQKNYNKGGFPDNRQTNATVIINTHYHGYQMASEREETPPLPGDRSMVPFLRDRQFVERSELAELERMTTSTSESRRVALVGLGGLGKSQLVIEYCRRLSERSPGTWVLWLHASSAARFDADIAKLADDVKIFGRKSPKADIFQLTYDWLRDRTHGNWVVVLDNADDADFLLRAPGAEDEGGNGGRSGSARETRARMDYLPKSQHGTVIITSRYQAMAEKLVDRCDIISVRPMTKMQAMELLGKSIGEPCDSAAMKLAATLDYIPLAIAQACVHIKKRQPRYSIEQYLAEFGGGEKARTGLLSRDLGELRRDREAANSILVTWQLSFEHMSRSRPSAADLLSLMSFFDHQDIPEYLLRAGEDKNPVKQHSSIQDFEEDIITLRDYDFITLTTSGSSFAMHRLVQLASRKWIESQGKYQQWVEHSLRKLDSVLPYGDDGEWQRCRELSSHTRLALELRAEGQKARKFRASILHKAAVFAFSQGLAQDAQVLVERNIQEPTSVLSPEGLDVLGCKVLLSVALRDQGKSKAAEQVASTALMSLAKALRPDRFLTLLSLAILAAGMERQGKYNRTEKMARVLMDGERLLVPEYRCILTAMQFFTEAAQDQDMRGPVEEIARRVMEDNEEARGMIHPETLEVTLNAGSSVLFHQGKDKEAEEVIQRAVARLQKALESEHIRTLRSMDALSEYQSLRTNTEQQGNGVSGC